MDWFIPANQGMLIWFLFTTNFCLCCLVSTFAQGVAHQVKEVFLRCSILNYKHRSLNPAWVTYDYRNSALHFFEMLDTKWRKANGENVTALKIRNLCSWKVECALKGAGIVWVVSHFWEHFAAKIVNRKGHYQVWVFSEAKVPKKG